MAINWNDTGNGFQSTPEDMDHFIANLTADEIAQALADYGNNPNSPRQAYQPTSYPQQRNLAFQGFNPLAPSTLSHLNSPRLYNDAVGWYRPAAYHPDIGGYIPASPPQSHASGFHTSHIRTSPSRHGRAPFSSPGTTRLSNNLASYRGQQQQPASQPYNDFNFNFVADHGFASRPTYQVPDLSPQLHSTAPPNRISIAQVCTCKGVSKKAKTVKRPENSWMIYRRVNSGKVLSRAKGNQAKASVLLSQDWKNESDEVKARFKKLADEEALQHKRDYPNYRYNAPQKDIIRREKDFGNPNCTCGAYIANIAARRQRLTNEAIGIISPRHAKKAEDREKNRARRKKARKSAAEEETEISLLNEMQALESPQQQSDRFMAIQNPPLPQNAGNKTTLGGKRKRTSKDSPLRPTSGGRDGYLMDIDDVGGDTLSFPSPAGQVSSSERRRSPRIARPSSSQETPYTSAVISPHCTSVSGYNADQPDSSFLAEFVHGELTSEDELFE